MRDLRGPEEPGVDQGKKNAAARDGAEGIAIEHDGRRVTLKWHRLRRRRSDPQFGLEALRQGLRLGASMEVDLRVTGDGSFVVVHDAILDRETEGTGEVAVQIAEELAGIHYEDQRLPGGGHNRRKVLRIEDLADLMDGAHPDALLQFDIKDDLTLVGDRGLACLTRFAAGKKFRAVVSGECLRLIERIKDALPNVKRGIDPTDRLLVFLRDGKMEELAARLRMEISGPTEPEFIYLGWPFILAARREGIDVVKICHGEGKKVDAWTFNLANPEKGFDDCEWRDFRKLLELGVDQITTDEAIATESAYERRVGSD
jgi:glycerophosphoryl diester phosphodiesterase